MTGRPRGHQGIAPPFGSAIHLDDRPSLRCGVASGSILARRGRPSCSVAMEGN